jgi:hypothetical protein
MGCSIPPNFSAYTLFIFVIRSGDRSSVVGRSVPNWHLGVAESWPQISRLTAFYFLVVIFFGSSSVELSFLNFLGE